MAIFIGRVGEMKWALDVLVDMVGVDPGADAGENGVVWDLSGMHGIGKSTLLHQLRRDADGLNKVLVIEEEMDRYAENILRAGDCGPDASAGALRSAFSRSCKVMLRAADFFDEHVDGAEFALFRRICERELQNARQFDLDHDLRTGERRGPRLDGDAVRTQLREFQQRVDDAFVEAWTERPRRAVLLTLDPFDDFVEDELGHWLIRMCLRLPDTLTVVARLPNERFPAHPRIVHRPLSPFTLDEVRQFLAERRKGVPLEDRVDVIVHDYTDGHPGGLDLAATLISQMPHPVSAVQLRKVLDRPPDDPDRAWARTINAILDIVPKSGLLRRALQAAAVVRTFDTPLLRQMLGTEVPGADEGDLPDEGAAKALRSLRQYGLAQVAGRPVSAERGREGIGEGYRLPEFIRFAVANELITANEEEWKELNQRAAAYYRAQLDENAAEVDIPDYGQWRRYEQARWQSDKRQWLYHTGQLEENRSRTRAQFVLVFLEAFYWWGCYHEFDFIWRLVEDWDRAAQSWIGHDSLERKNDQKLATALRAILEKYPAGHRKQATQSAWDTILEQLLHIQDVCGLLREPAEGEEQRAARTNALVNIFLAHSRRYRDPTDPEGLEYYEEALFSLEMLGDEWLPCWIVFEIGDLHVEAGRLEEASASLEQATGMLLQLVAAKGNGGKKKIEYYRSTRQLLDVWDHELASNIYRATADVSWLRGDLGGSAANYGRALEHAYWFLGDPQPPDPYTVQFYGEIVSRIEERMAECGARGEGDPAFLDAVVNNVRLRTGAGDWERLSLAPEPEDRNRADSTFMSGWLRNWSRAADLTGRLRSLLPAGSDGPEHTDPGSSG